MAREVVLTISDQHFPWHHPKMLRFLEQLKKEYKPNRIVNLGDEFDLYRLSRFDHDPDSLGASSEIAWGLKEIKKLYELFPEVHSCTSNHSARGVRLAFRFGLPSLFMRTIKEWMQAPIGWTWKDYWIFDQVRYFHGEPYSSNTWMKASKDFRMSTCIGHVHANAGVIYSEVAHGPRIFSANAGCLIDDKEDPVSGKAPYAFAYGKQLPSRPTIGTCVILDNGRRAEFIPLE